MHLTFATAGQYRNCHGILDATAAALTADTWPLRGCSLSVYVTIMNPLTRLHEYATKGPWQAPAAEEEQEGALAPEGSRERVSASDHAFKGLHEDIEISSDAAPGR